MSGYRPRLTDYCSSHVISVPCSAKLFFGVFRCQWQSTPCVHDYTKTYSLPAAAATCGWMPGGRWRSFVESHCLRLCFASFNAPSKSILPWAPAVEVKDHFIDIRNLAVAIATSTTPIQSISLHQAPAPSGCVGSIHLTLSGTSTGSNPGKLIATASLSLRISTHSSFSSSLALIS